MCVAGMQYNTAKLLSAEYAGLESLAFSDSVDQLSKLVVESYVETDEDIGPRVAQFDKAHSQLKLIGEQLTSMRDATSATHEAHMQLVTLMEGGESSIPSIQAFGERQESQGPQSRACGRHASSERHLVRPPQPGWAGSRRAGGWDLRLGSAVGICCWDLSWDL